MVVAQSGIKVTFPRGFEETWKDFLKEIDSDIDYKRAIKDKLVKDKRFKKGRQDSAKVRFAIAYYLRNRKQKKLMEMQQHEQHS